VMTGAVIIIEIGAFRIMTFIFNHRFIYKIKKQKA
jgi:hypothetical protein